MQELSIEQRFKIVELREEFKSMTREQVEDKAIQLLVERMVLARAIEDRLNRLELRTATNELTTQSMVNQMKHTTIAEQALNHPGITSENPWEDCFYRLPLHIYSTGVPFSGGIWQVDGAWACVFEDCSMVVWDEQTKSWKAGTWDIDEALSSFDEEVAAEIKQKVNGAIEAG